MGTFQPIVAVTTSAALILQVALTQTAALISFPTETPSPGSRMPNKRICVIGAGPSGMSVLCWAAKFAREGRKVPEIVCYEKQSERGARPWQHVPVSLVKWPQGVSGAPPLHLRATLREANSFFSTEGGSLRLSEGEMEQGGCQGHDHLQPRRQGRRLQQRQGQLHRGR